MEFLIWRIIALQYCVGFHHISTWISQQYMKSSTFLASLEAQRLKRLPPMQATWVWSLGWEDPLEKEMATHASILAWRIPWTEELGRLQSTGSQRVGHDWAISLSFHFSIFHCIYVAELLYPFICQWASRLLPCPRCCKQCCRGHWVHVSFSITVSLRVYAQ